MRFNMWFKSARFYTVDFSEINNYFENEEAMEEALQKVAFRPCAAQETATIGFTPIFGREGVYHFSSGENHFFKLYEENKLLPTSVIRDELEELVEEKELELKRVLRKNEKDALKSAVTSKLLAQAFATHRELIIWCNFAKNIVGVSANSAKRAEKALAMLREAFGTFPAELLAPKILVDKTLTDYLKDNSLPNKLTFGFEATLKSEGESGGTVRILKEELTSDEVMVHLNSGKVVQEIGLCFDESLEFNLLTDLSVKKLKLTDIYLEHHASEKTDDEIADMQSLLVLQGELFTEFLTYLLELFNCEHK